MLSYFCMIHGNFYQVKICIEQPSRFLFLHLKYQPVCFCLKRQSRQYSYL